MPKYDRTLADLPCIIQAQLRSTCCAISRARIFSVNGAVLYFARLPVAIRRGSDGHACVGSAVAATRWPPFFRQSTAGVDDRDVPCQKPDVIDAQLEVCAPHQLFEERFGSGDFD
jgi:hypothetical protein